MSATNPTARVTWPLGLSLGSGRSAREREAAALVGGAACRVRMFCNRVVLRWHRGVSV